MSSVPPPFAPRVERPRKSLSPIIIVVVVFAVLCIGGVAALTFMLAPYIRDGLPFAGCMMNFQDARDSVVNYAREHNGKLPNAATWQTEVKPYYAKVIAKVEDRGPLKTMAVDGEWGCDKVNTGMAFNSNLSGKPIDKLPDGDDGILLFEVPARKMNANEPYKYRGKEGSPMIKDKHRGWIRIRATGEPMIDTTVINVQDGKN